MSQEVPIRFKPGGLLTTINEAAVGLEASPDIKNCSTEESVWKVDKRQRRFNAADTDFSAGLTQGLGFYSDKDYQRFVALNNAKIRAIDGTYTGSGIGTNQDWDAYDYEGACGPDISTGDYVMWQHQKLMFMAGGANGRVFFTKMNMDANAGDDPCSILYRDYFLDTGGEVKISVPPYKLSKEFSIASDTLAVNHNTGYGNILPDGGWEYFRPGFQDGNTNVEFTFTLGSTINLERVDYLYFEGKNLDKDFFRRADGRVFQLGSSQEGYDFAVSEDGGTTWHEAKIIPIAISADPNIVVFYVDLTDIARADRNAVNAIRTTHLINIHDDIEIVYTPIRYGAVWTGFDTGDGYLYDLDPRTEDEEIEYAFAYYDVSLAAFSNAFRLDSVPKINTIGEKIDSRSHFMGSKTSFTLEPTNNAPYVATDKIVLYRRKTNGDWVEITDSATHGLAGGPSRVDNQNDPTTDDPPTIYDNLTQDEVDGLAAVGSLTFDTEVDPTPSGAVTDIECGTSWKGANCMGGSDGRVFMSDAVEFRRTLWDDVDIGPIAGDNADPRTVEVTPDPIVAMSGQDALYVASRTQAFAFVGDVPNKSNLVRLPLVRGCISKFGMNAYGGGVLMATDDGLWQIAIPPPVFGVAQEIKPNELTAGIRPTWETLVGTTEAQRQKTVVVHHHQHIWVFNGTDYLHRWPSGKWVFGTWADGLDVKRASSDPFYGIVLLDADGNVHTIGDFSTDGDTAVAGSGGTAVTWEYKTGKLFFDADPRTLSVKHNQIGTKGASYAESAAAVEVFSDKQERFSGAGGLTNPETIDFKDWRELKKGWPKPAGGRWFQLNIKGNGDDEFYDIMVATLQDNPTRGHIS